MGIVGVIAVAGQPAQAAVTRLAYVVAGAASVADDNATKLSYMGHNVRQPASLRVTAAIRAMAQKRAQLLF